MKSDQIRQTFLKFFEERGHAIIPSAPVVPQHDPTVLFTTAGMHPLVPYLLGEPHPAGKRLADVQKCIRTSDIDEVGDESHLTFFEMLGNWSLGDYFKEEAITWSWELLTKGFKLDPSKMAVSVFEVDSFAVDGEKPGPMTDTESLELWRKQGVPDERIYRYGYEDNWWGPAGQTGPCGPDTEIFYWVGEGEPELKPGPAEDGRWLEIWNNVFMEYDKVEPRKLIRLAQKNVDTGMGLERLAVILQGKKNVYETDLFTPIINKISGIKKVLVDDDPELIKSVRIISDHLKAATFMVADGVRPSNTDQGYVLRRLIRRAIREGQFVEIRDNFTHLVAEVVISQYANTYPELKHEKKVIFSEFSKEEEKFRLTVTRGIQKLYQKMIGKAGQGPSKDPRAAMSLIVSKKFPNEYGHVLFEVYETDGLPFELSINELRRWNCDFDEAGLKKEFEKAQKAHQEKSRSGAEQKFAGGLADHSDKVVRQHTATHLLLAALRDVLGDEVKQRGSNITAERLRFDFSYGEKLTDEQRNQVEALVNEWIKEDLPVTRKEIPKAEAEKLGAQSEFGHKYPDVVSVYLIGDPGKEVSIEFCGGPHVEHTGEIDQFTLKKQESVGAGVRRIKAIVK